MKYYQEITLIPDPVGMPLSYLQQRLFYQVHAALAREPGDNSVGISFPDYDGEGCQLGNKIRLLAPTEDILKNLQLRHLLLRLSDYSHLSDIRQVPEKIESYAFFRRVQPKTSLGSIARRKARREGITVDEALNLLGPPKKTPKLPAVSMESKSSGQQYPLFVSRVLSDEPATGSYSTYGLSSTGTVPLF